MPRSNRLRRLQPQSVISRRAKASTRRWKCPEIQEHYTKPFVPFKNGGRVSLFGIPTGPVSFDLPNEIIFKGIRVYGVTGRRLFDTWYRLAGLFKAGLDIRTVVTHVFPMSEFAKGFELVKAGMCGKVVLLP
jgi:threonine 3-dehydrogenase